jgi:aminopeptidase N
MRIVVGLCCLLWLPMAAGAEPAASSRIMLPSDVTPDRYRIDVTPEASQLTFRGTVLIDLQAHRPVERIALNSSELVIDRATLDAGTASLPVSYDSARQTVTVALGHTIPPGAHRLKLSYHGRIYKQPSGLFALDYDTQQGRRRALYTQFEPTEARRFVPCWDEPERKAVFELTATVPEDQMAVSNMPVTATDAAANGLRRVHFGATPKMSSYLLFFAVGDFERIHRQVGAVDVGVIFKRGDAGRARFALDSAAALLPYYDSYFGTRYPLPKLDLIAGPGSSAYFGAMENWGAIYSFEHDLLADPRLATESDRQDIYLTIAHEMAHQWFGDLVTMRWWTDLWLNEGFASWMERNAAEHFHPEWHTWLQFEHTRNLAMELDARTGTHPIIEALRDALQVGSAFDSITYIKGAAVIRTLEAYTGDTEFRQGVRRYMREHAYGNTVTEQLWDAVDRGAARPVRRIAHDLTLQAGVPMITEQAAACRNAQTELTVSQGRYVVDPGSATATLWHVPLTARTSGAPATTTLIAGPTPQRMQLPGCGPVLLNAGQLAYLRSRYSPSGFGAIVADYAQLGAEDQLGLFDDSESLANNGELDMGSFLELVAAVPPDAMPEVLSALTQALRGMDRLHNGLPSQADFQRWGRARLAPILQRVGWQKQAGETANVALLRSALLDTLSELDDDSVVDQARRNLSTLEADDSALPPGLRHSTLQIVARHADQTTWDQLHAMARSAGSELERDELYPMLGLAKDPALVQQALALAISGEPPQTLVFPMLRDASLAQPRLATEFAIEHWDRIGPMIDPVIGPRTVARLGSNGWDTSLIEPLERFANDHMPSGDARREFGSAVALIRWRDGFRSKRIPQIDSWVGRHSPAAAPVEANSPAPR